MLRASNIIAVTIPLILAVVAPFQVVPAPTTVTPLPVGVERVERVEKLGFGFRRETHAELTHGGFEGIMHQEYLFYGDQQLCNVGSCSVAPSGKFAIYQDGPSGNLFLFRRADRKITQLTPKFIALVEKFVWHEDRGIVNVQFETGHPLQKFPLQ